MDTYLLSGHCGPTAQESQTQSLGALSSRWLGGRLRVVLALTRRPLTRVSWVPKTQKSKPRPL